MTSFVLALVASSAAARATDEALPDLRMLKPNDLSIQKPGGTLKLRFAANVANHGVGPLEVQSEPGARTDCNNDRVVSDHYADQHIYLDTNGNGHYDPGDSGAYDTIAKVGCRHYSKSHGYWQFDDSGRYKLRREANGKVVARRTKVSFCLLDGARRYPNLPGSPDSGQYPGTCDEYSRQGLSIGWSDVYPSFLPGQALKVGGLAKGNYCLIVTADPKNWLEETHEGNNTARRRLRLRPKERRVTPLPGRCRS